MSAYKLEFITPLFSRGAYEDRPEVRPPSIRGQLHWWFRALGGNYGDETAIFGGVHGGATASKVVIRVANVQGNKGKVATLPHKPGRPAPKDCYLPGTSFELYVLSRLGGLSGGHRLQFQRSLEVWLLLGSLGLRSTRGSGSFCWKPLAGGELAYPASWREYAERCSALLRGSRLRFALLDDVYEDAESARGVVSDTLGGPDQADDLNDLRDLNWPLGDVSSRRQREADPTRRERKTSPLRFRIAKIGAEYRVAAIWDDREEVTGNRPGDLGSLVKLLEKGKPALGRQLVKCGFGQ
jgi:hypothetical protein